MAVFTLCFLISPSFILYQCPNFLLIWNLIPSGFRDHPTSVWGFPGGSVGKESACNSVDLGLIPRSVRFPWIRKWQLTPVFLPGESHGQGSLVGYRPQGHKQSDTTEETEHARTPLVCSLSRLTFMHWRRKWQPTPVFLPGESHGQRSLVGYSPKGHK